MVDCVKPYISVAFTRQELGTPEWTKVVGRVLVPNNLVVSFGIARIPDGFYPLYTNTSV